MLDADLPSVPKLHHLALGARDVESVAAFYRDVLRLPELSRQRRADGSLRAVWLGLGGGAVLMIEDALSDAPPAQSSGGQGGGGQGGGSGLFLLALGIFREERGAWEARLAAAGAPIEARTAATSYARDPEGNRVAVSFYSLPPCPAPAVRGSTSSEATLTLDPSESGTKGSEVQ